MPEELILNKTAIIFSYRRTYPTEHREVVQAHLFYTTKIVNNFRMLKLFTYVFFYQPIYSFYPKKQMSSTRKIPENSCQSRSF